MELIEKRVIFTNIYHALKQSDFQNLPVSIGLFVLAPIAVRLKLGNIFKYNVMRKPMNYQVIM